MNNDTGLFFAILLDGAGGGSEVDFDTIKKWSPNDGTLWVHLDYSETQAQEWLKNDSGIDPIISEAMTEIETRPRSFVYKDGMLIILRGVNQNPGADPEDMVSIRLWIDSKRIISLRQRRVIAINDVRQAIKNGDGPTSSGSFLEELSSRLILRMGNIISEIDDTADALEDEIINIPNYETRQKIADVRRTAISLRRYIAPQRDVIERLHNEKVTWLSDVDRMRLRETADSTTRYVEDLDAIRDRAIVTQEELSNRLAEQMNKTMYLLAIITAIFMPLGLLTGLLGINIGGMPGTDSPWAFTIFCVLLAVIATGLVLFFKRKKWI